MTPPARTTEVLAHFAAESASSEELIRWATQALLDGYDTPALIELGSLAPADVRLSDAVVVFQRALDELGIVHFPPTEDALRAQALAIALLICERKISPRDGAYRIFHEALQPLRYPRDLMGWYFLYDGTHYPTHRELLGAELDEVILEEARNLVEGRSFTG